MTLVSGLMCRDAVMVAWESAMAFVSCIAGFSLSGRDG